MDHEIYAYRSRSRIPGSARPPARLQAFAVLVLEHWDADPPADARRDPRFVGEYGSFDPDFRSWTQREYGLRIGMFRVLDALEQAGIRPAVAINAQLAHRLPDLVARLESLGIEWIAHGLAANRMMHAGMSITEQRGYIVESTEMLAREIGTRPAGWLSQDWGTSPATYDLLAEAGFQYTLDWCNDDAPFPLQTARPMMALPLSAEWDDVQCQWLRNLDPHAHAALTERAFLRLRQECMTGQGAACFGLPIHPWVSGMSSRIGALRALLSRLTVLTDVDWRMPGEILAQWPDLASTGAPRS